MFINYNGTFCKKVIIEDTNRSFLYGDGFFESLRLFNGKIFNRDHHTTRVQKTLVELHLLLDISIEELLDKTEELVKKNGLTQGSSARITFFRNEGGLYTPSTNQASYLIKTEYNNHNAFELIDGINLGICTQYIKSAQPLSSIKSSSAMVYVLASMQKTYQGVDEILLLNQRSTIVEATNANIFVVRNNQLLTPPLSDGGVDGTMRALIMTHFEVEEASLVTNDIEKADELILSNCHSIRWVKRYKNNHHYVNHKSMEIVQFLNRLI